MTNLRMRIRTPSRLHFGLLGWGPQAGRQFGGVGLMIDSPGIDLLVEPASSWLIEGPHARAGRAACRRIWNERSREAGMTLPPAHIRVVERPARTCRPGSRNSALPGRRPRGLPACRRERRIGRGARAMDRPRPPLGNRPARLRAWRVHRRWGKEKRSRYPSSPGAPAVSGGLVDPGRATAGRERPARPRREPGLRQPAALHPGRDRLALPPGPPRDPPRGPRARSARFWCGAR